MKKSLLLVGAVTAIVVIVAAVAFALVRSNSQPAPTDEHEHLHDPRTASAEEAATAAMTGLLTWTPAQQSGPWEAASAIAPQLTGNLAAYAASPDGNGEPVPENWESWAAGGDRVQGFAVVSPDNKEAAAASPVATVTVDVEQRVWHPDGDMTPLTKGTVNVTVELVDEQWKASNYSYTSVLY